MCRLLLIENPAGVDPNLYLAHFRRICQESREYQGHGWGCAWLEPDDRWQLYHSIVPIWEDPKGDFPSTGLFLAHARSAFRDEGITIENNMPFTDGSSVFLFNGELQGVRIRSEGRIGAEKIYRYILRFDRGDLGAAMQKGIGIIARKTRYIRAMNFFLATAQAVHVSSWFGEDPAYFQMHRTRTGNTLILCSAPLPALALSWEGLPNHWQGTIRHNPAGMSMAPRAPGSDHESP